MTQKPVQSLNSITKMQEGGAPDAPADPIQADFNKGKGYLERNELSLAAAAFHNALIGYQEKGDDPGIANASNQMGHVCLARKEYDQALEHYGQAWKICERLGDQMSLLALSHQYLQVFREQGNFQKAISLSLDLLDKYFANNDPRGAVDILEKMAEIYLEAGKKEKAADAYRTIASIHDNFTHKNIAKSFREKAEELEQGI